MQTSNPTQDKKRLYAFLGLTFGLSSIFYFLIISAGTLQVAGGLYVLGIMWCPGIAALVTTYIFQKDLKGLGWQWGSTSLQVKSYFLPVLYGIVVYGLVWLIGMGDLDLSQFKVRELSLIPSILLFVGVGTVEGSIFALGEEIGWRGYLFPALAKQLNFNKAAMLTGSIWGVWHLPLLFFADYNSETNLFYAALCFMIMAIGMSYIMGWFRLKSGSVWTAMIMHATHNLYIQGFFDVVTVDTGITKWITTEFGIGLAIGIGLLGFYYYQKREELLVEETTVQEVENIKG